MQSLGVAALQNKDIGQFGARNKKVFSIPNRQAGHSTSLEKATVLSLD